VFWICWRSGTTGKAGYSDAAALASDKELTPLRDRDDFKKLVAGLEAKRPQK
jgi:hypothetical protein